MVRQLNRVGRKVGLMSGVVETGLVDFILFDCYD